MQLPGRWLEYDRQVEMRRGGMTRGNILPTPPDLESRANLPVICFRTRSMCVKPKDEDPLGLCTVYRPFHFRRLTLTTQLTVRPSRYPEIWKSLSISGGAFHRFIDSTAFTLSRARDHKLFGRIDPAIAFCQPSIMGNVPARLITGFRHFSSTPAVLVCPV